MQKPVNNQRPELRVRYSPEEFSRLKKAFARTAYNQIGTYARKMTLGEPIEVVFRNGSFDAFVEEIAQMRKVLLFICTNDYLSPENQQRLVSQYQKIQETIDKIIDLCMRPSTLAPVSPGS